MSTTGTLHHATTPFPQVYYFTLKTPALPSLKYTDYRPRPWEYHLRLRRWLKRRIKGA